MRLRHSLRWTLLIIGVVFVAVLAWWERRKPHQAARDAGQVRPNLSEPTWGPEPEAPAVRSFREPTLTLPVSPKAGLGRQGSWSSHCRSPRWADPRQRSRRRHG